MIANIISFGMTAAFFYMVGGILTFIVLKDKIIQVDPLGNSLDYIIKWPKYLKSIMWDARK